MNNRVLFIARAALIAAVYTIVTVLIAPYAYGIFQFRVSEALTVLPAIMSSAIPGLFVGCLVSNIIGGYGPIDIIFGSIATLISALLSRKLRKYPYLVPLPPVVINALIVGGYLPFLYFPDVPVPVSMGWVALGQLLACYGLGYPLLVLLTRRFGNYFKDW